MKCPEDAVQGSHSGTNGKMVMSTDVSELNSTTEINILTLISVDVGEDDLGIKEDSDEEGYETDRSNAEGSSFEPENYIFAEKSDEVVVVLEVLLMNRRRQLHGMMWGTIVVQKTLRGRQRRLTKLRHLKNSLEQKGAPQQRTIDKERPEQKMDRLEAMSWREWRLLDIELSVGIGYIALWECKLCIRTRNAAFCIQKVLILAQTLKHVIVQRRKDKYKCKTALCNQSNKDSRKLKQFVNHSNRCLGYDATTAGASPTTVRVK